MQSHAFPPPSILLATELKDVILLNVILKMVFDNERIAGWKVGREPGDGIRGGVGGKRRRQELEEEEARAGGDIREDDNG